MIQQVSPKSQGGPTNPICKPINMRLFLSLFILLIFAGCQQAAETPAPTSSAASEVQPAAQETPAGEPSYSFTIPGDSAPSKIYVSADELRVGKQWKASMANNGDVDVTENGQLKARGTFQKEGRFLVNDPSGNLLAKIKVRDDGTFKVVDKNEKMLCKLKSRDDGFKVVGPDEETVLIKVKASDGKTKIKDGKEQELAKFKGSDDPTVVTWLAVPVLPMEVRLAGALLFRGSK